MIQGKTRGSKSREAQKEVFFLSDFRSSTSCRQVMNKAKEEENRLENIHDFKETR